MAALQVFLESLPHPAWLSDATGDVFFVNQQWEEVTGLPRTLAAMRESVHPDDRPIVAQAVAQTTTVGGGRSYRVRLQARGEYRWFEIRATPLKGDPAGRYIGTGTDVHEDEVARQALERRDRELRALLDTHDSFVWTGDSCGNLISASENWERFSGLTLEETTARFEELVHPDDIGPALQRWRAAIDAGTPLSQEFRLWDRRRGEYRWMSQRLMATRLPDGRIDGWTGVTIDIHESRRSEERLRQTQESLALAQKGGRMGWWKRDLVTDEVTWSPELEHLFGFDPGTFPNTRTAFLNQVLEEDREKVTDAVRQAVDANTDYSVEFRFRRQDGSIGWMDGRGRAVYRDGIPVASYGVGIDISDRKTSEQRLLDSEARYRLLADSVPVMVWTTDSAGNLDLVNTAWLDYFGMGLDESRDRSWLDFIYPDQLGPVQRAWAEARGRTQEFAMEVRLRRHDGTYRWHLCIAKPNRTEKGAIGWVGSMVDIHDLKAKEATMRFLVSLEESTRGSEEPTEAIDALTRMLGRYLDADRCLYVEFDGNEREFSIISAYPQDSRAGHERNSLESFGEDLTRQLREGRTFVAHDIESEISSSRLRATLRARDVAATISVPVRRRGRLLSVISVQQSHPRRWTEEEIELVEMVADRSYANIERLRAVRRLRQSEERLRYALSAADAGIWDLDVSADRIVWSPEVYRLFGVDPSTRLSYEYVNTLIHPEDLPRVETALDRSMRNQGDFRVEFRVTHPDLGLRWLVASGGVVERTRMTGIMYDITDAKSQLAVMDATLKVGQALASERETESIVQALTDASTKAIGAEFGSFFYNVVDERGEVLTLYTLSGAPLEAFAGFPMPRATKVFGPTFRGEGTIRSDDITKDADYGQSAPFHGMPAGHLPVRSYLAIPVVSRSGEVLGGLFFGHGRPGMFSESDARMVEAFASQAAIAYENAMLYRQLRVANEELERKVRERTADLQASVEALKGFTYHVSHDLRAPLRAIISTSRMVQDDFGAALPAEAQKLLDRQADAARRLGNLIDDLLRLSRLSHEELTRQSVDLTELAHEVTDEAMVSHPETAVRVAIQEGLEVEADPRLFRLALLNLVENAIKYSPHGGTVEVGRRPDGVYFVSDEGIGIEPQYLERIFEPFQRLHRDDQFGGTGIGLANVRQVIERHGGRVWAESQPEKGTRFLFEL